LAHYRSSRSHAIQINVTRAQERKQKEQENAMRADALLRGNPLVQPSGSASSNVKRRWDDDVVFRNMARDEPAEKKRFINDTIRSDFHRRFLKRYVQ
jgi:protein CWC15